MSAYYLTYEGYLVWFNGEDMRNDDIDIQFLQFYCSHNMAMLINAFTPSIPASTSIVQIVNLLISQQSVSFPLSHALGEE